MDEKNDEIKKLWQDLRAIAKDIKHLAKMHKDLSQNCDVIIFPSPYTDEITAKFIEFNQTCEKIYALSQSKLYD